MLLGGGRDIEAAEGIVWKMQLYTKLKDLM